jgi:hypothetical protein
MPHKHAEFFKGIADGDSLLDWEFRSTDGIKWRPCTPDFIGNAYLCCDSFDVRRKPQPRVIAWSKVATYVPVRMWDLKDNGLIAFFHSFGGCEALPFTVSSGSRWRHASLETGLWVANVDGVNPWPEGVLVEVLLRDGNPMRARAAQSWLWSHAKKDTDYECREADIIASRCVGLAEGWSYE